MDPNSILVFNDKLNRLGDLEKEATIAKALQEGARVIAEKGKQNIKSRHHVKTGKLLKSVSVLTKKKSGKAYAGFKYGNGYGGAVAHLIDRGAVRVKRGVVKGDKFWTDAVNSKRDDAMKKINESIQATITRIINR